MLNQIPPSLLAQEPLNQAAPAHFPTSSCQLSNLVPPPALNFSLVLKKTSFKISVGEYRPVISAMITDRQIEPSLKIKLIADFQTSRLEKNIMKL